MSIKAFSNQYCDTCKQDTLHHVCKCRQCGTVKRTPTEIRNNARVMLAIKYINKYGKYGPGLMAVNIAKDRPKGVKRIRPDLPPKRNHSIFGKKRSRIKA